MKKIYSVLVENRSGVLCKVAGLFPEERLTLTVWWLERQTIRVFPA